MSKDKLPSVVEQFAEDRPDVWNAYNQLAQATLEAGPLDEKTARLIKLGIAIGAARRGAVRAHARRGAGVGLTRQELEHVALLGITTVGWPAAFASLCWIQEALEDAKPDQ